MHVTSSSPLFFLTACEASGDQLGAAIIAELKQCIPAARFIGVAGPLMRAQGCEVIIAQEELAIMGLVEVIKNLGKLLKARAQVKMKALQLKPDVYIGIDAPDFNLPIEKLLKRQQIKTVHVNSPTIWAWRSGRIHGIKRAVDLMLTLFPFETAIYEQYQVPVKFIGHPLAEKIPLQVDKAAAKQKLGFAKDKKIIAIMPGSRKAEIEHIAPVFIEAASLYFQQHPEVQFVAPMVNEKRAEQFKKYLPSTLPVQITVANAHEVLMAADAVLIGSGTATLEAMLCKTPMVIAYKADALSFWIARKLVKIPYVGLPNILAGKFLVPELLQEKATAANIFEQLQNILQVNGQLNILSQFEKIHLSLRQNAAQAVAAAIMDVM